MFGAYVFEISSAEYENNVLLIDEAGTLPITDFRLSAMRTIFSIVLKSKDR